MAIAQYHLHDEINAEEAITLWEASGSGARKASGFTYKGDKIIARHDASLTFESFEALVLAADKVIFWHYGYNTKCSRDLDIRIGDANFTIDVECDLTREKPKR